MRIGIRLAAALCCACLVTSLSVTVRAQDPPAGENRPKAALGLYMKAYPDHEIEDLRLAMDFWSNAMQTEEGIRKSRNRPNRRRKSSACSNRLRVSLSPNPPGLKPQRRSPRLSLHRRSRWLSRRRPLSRGRRGLRSKWTRPWRLADWTRSQPRSRRPPSLCWIRISSRAVWRLQGQIWRRASHRVRPYP